MLGHDMHDFILFLLIIVVFLGYYFFNTPWKRVHGCYLFPMGDTCPGCWTVHMDKKTKDMGIGMISSLDKKRYIASVDNITICENVTLAEAIRKIKDYRDTNRK